MFSPKYLRVASLLAVILAYTGCSSSSPLPQFNATPCAEFALQAPSELSTESPVSLAEQFKQVEDAPVPEGVEPQLFEMLRAQLISILADRQPAAANPSLPVTGSSAPPRSVSFTPYGAVNGVNDLALSGNDPARLSWTYRNKGDYDLNGMVNVSDLTPIGIYYGMTDSDARWLLAKAADGDNNGMITVSDITPIGQYFGGTITGYQVWGTDDTSGEWTYIGNATVEVNLNKNPLRPRFVVELPSVDHEYYSIWPYDSSDDGGWWSNIAGPGLPEKRYVINMENIWQPAS